MADGTENVLNEQGQHTIFGNASFDRFRVLFNTSSDAVILHDKKKILDANLAAERISGYTKQELAGMPLKKLLKGNAVLKKEGGKLEVFMRQFPVDGTWVLVMTDTGAQLALERYSSLFSSVAATAMDTVVVLDGSMNIIDVSDGAPQAFGYPKEELVGKKMKELMGWGSKKDTILKQAREKRVSAKVSCKRKDGGTFDAELAAAPYSGGILCVLRDMSERESLLAQVENANELHNQLVNTVADIIFEIDAEGTLKYVNNQFEKQLGHKQNSVKTLVSLIHPDDLQSVMTKLADAQMKREGFRDLEFRVQNAKKKWIYFSANAIPNAKKGQGVNGFRGTIRNIDLKKKAEDKTELARKELERRKKELEEMNRLKSEFVSNVSHELKTPLTSVRGYSALLKDKTLGELTKEQMDAVEIINKESLTLAKLINDLLDISKLEAGAVTLNRRPFLLGSLEEKCSCKTLAQAKGLTLIWNTPDSIGEIDGDPDRVAQVLTNLVSNAIKFTGAGSVTVNAFAKDKKFVEVDVIDTGMGIPPKEKDNLFKRFSQIHEKREKKEGTGLGLAISKHIVELHGGIIDVDSRPSKGSKFFFTLPRVTSDGKKKDSEKTGLESITVSQEQQSPEGQKSGPAALQ